jgi:thiamine kinase-like enzyme
MHDTGIDLHALFKALHDSVGVECLSAQPLSGGSNNQLYRIDTREGKRLLAKKYFPDNRSRLEREYSVLTVLSDQSFNEVPFPVARLDELETGVYSFIEGQRVASSDFTHDHIEKIAAYLAKLHDVKRDAVSREIPMGFMSARSFSEVIALIRGRFAPFVGAKLEIFPTNLRYFLKEEAVIELIESLLETFIRNHDAEHLDRQLPSDDLRLTSVDFGAHNMLWRADGSLVVLDFEYGGWDHPLRVIADFLSHEKNQAMGSENMEYFVAEYLRRSPLSKEILRELNDYRYLSHLEWMMVYLSSMLPDKLARLAFAKGSSHDTEEYIERQIAKARERISRLSPYGA